MKYAVLFVVLAATWLVLSGKTTPLFLIIGFLCCILVVWLARRLETVDHESVPVQLKASVITYWAWLIKEIFLSAWQVSKIVLSPRLSISPQIVKVTAEAHTEVGRVIFGNSITLTPGTVTIDIDDKGVLTVHALTEDGAQGVLNGDMNHRVRLIEGAHT
jgi:multicomponent Na+:H+ antiporter subunit E